MSLMLPLETERLWLRPFVEDDIEAYFRMGSDPAIIRYTGAEPLQSLAEARAVLQANPLADYQKHGYGRWACVGKPSGQVIGFAGLKYLDDLQEVDLGYRLFPEYWGLGLATEASRAALRYGFETLQLAKIIGLVMPENAASVHVLEKLGFTFEALIDYRNCRVVKYVRSRSGPGMLPENGGDVL